VTAHPPEISESLGRFLAVTFNPEVQELRYQLADTLAGSSSSEYVARIRRELYDMVRRRALSVSEWETLTGDDEFEDEAALYSFLEELLRENFGPAPAGPA
jgi:hypothetical protein